MTFTHSGCTREAVDASPGCVQGQAGCGFEQPGLASGIPTHDKGGLELDEL